MMLFSEGIKFGAAYPSLEDHKSLPWNINETKYVDFFPENPPVKVTLISVESDDLEFHLRNLGDNQTLCTRP